MNNAFKSAHLPITFVLHLFYICFTSCPPVAPTCSASCSRLESCSLLDLTLHGSSPLSLTSAATSCLCTLSMCCASSLPAHGLLEAQTFGCILRRFVAGRLPPPHSQGRYLYRSCVQPLRLSPLGSARVAYFNISNAHRPCGAASPACC